jgi:glycosyltransferase involved in cell wall biosynthesis
MRPLVSVVTPTWQRPELLAETIRHLREQDYPNMLEHLIVSDGPDMRVEQVLDHARLRTEYGNPQLFSVQLGRNWSGLMPSSFGIAPLLVGYLMARGDYVANLSDDDRMSPDYISRLVALLEETGADFAYSKARFYWSDQRPEDGYDIGTDPPQHGQITSMVARTSCFWRFGMPRWSSHPVDWSLISDWISAGARWAFLPEVLFWHRADQRG